MPIDRQTCACGSGRLYAQCCGRYIDGLDAAPTAQDLMRSRYTAFARRRTDYILKTWHSSTRPKSLGLPPAHGFLWIGLRILDVRAGGEQDNEGTVEFVASFKENGKAARLHELSRFVRENGQWFYVDRDIR